MVDDDQSVRRGLRRLFKSTGHAAEMFVSAEDYLARESDGGDAESGSAIAMGRKNKMDLSVGIA